MSGRIFKHLVVLIGAFSLMEAFLLRELFGYKEECIAELKLDPSKFAKQGHPPSEVHMNLTRLDATDHDTRCFFRCLLQKYGAIDDEDEFQLDKLKELYRDDVVNEIDYVKCMSITNSDPCQKVFLRCRCIVQQVISLKGGK